MDEAAIQATRTDSNTSTAPAASPVSRTVSRTVGLICNPNSGRNQQQLAAIEAAIGQCANIVYVPTASEDDIPAAITRFAQANIDVLAINGGDGTVAHVLTHLLRSRAFETLPGLVLLPGGTTNMNVGDVGIPGKIQDAIHKLIRWSQGELPDLETRSRPILQIQPGDSGQPLYGMIFGTGAIIQAIEYWHASVKQKGFRNEFSSGLALLRTVWGLIRRDPRFARPLPLDIRFSDASGNARHIQQENMMMFVSCMPRVFLGFTPFWGTGDGALRMTIVRDRAERFLCTLPAFLRGRPNRRLTVAAGYESHNVNSLTIAMTGAYTLDGEILHIQQQQGPLQIRHYCDMPFLRF